MTTMTDEGDPVIVGVDGSESAQSAARWAGAIAERFDAPLRVVHGVPRLGPNLTEAAAAFKAAMLTYQAENAETFLKEAADAVRCERPGLTVTTAATSDPIDDVLIDASARARFVVVGGVEISPAAAVLLGSTTLTLATHASCPIVAWRGSNTSPTSGPVVVGVDDTPAGRAAGTAAFDVAARLGVAVHAVHAWSISSSSGEMTIPFLIDWDDVEAQQFAALTDLVDEFRRDHEGVEVQCFLEKGASGRALLEHLDDAQLVVVGNRGRPALTAVAMGSTSLNMLHHSNVPVMVCHAATDGRRPVHAEVT
jgi:nucleotide-binding universal stress UspA family protein